MIYDKLLSLKYSARKTKNKTKKAETVEEIKTYLNSEILREPWNIHKFNFF